MKGRLVALTVLPFVSTQAVATGGERGGSHGAEGIVRHLMASEVRIDAVLCIQNVPLPFCGYLLVCFVGARLDAVGIANAVG